MATQKKSTTKAAKKVARKTSSKGASASSNEIDRQLERYQAMRDFDVTEEPSGKAKTGPSGSTNKAKLPFVIQKHAASHLHYDFRLGWNGVLKSWASAKGPSYFPGDRRLAVQVEDHPIEYGGFEGMIPQGQYGGGTVMLWDQGTWEPQAGHTDVDAGLKVGSLKFTMYGKKMKGNWTLIRMGGKAANEKKPNWLLIKEHDEFERGEKDKPITEEAPNSVATTRSLEEIAANQDHVWNSKDPKDPKGKSALKTPTERTAVEQKPMVIDAKGAKEALPAFVKPQLALQATSPPATSGWVHELKLDGYRMQGRKDGKNVELLTRSGLDWTHRMEPIAAAVAALPVKTCILDGEVVVLSENGTTSFADLQAAFQDGAKKPLTYFVFDLLHLNGHNLRNLPLSERKELLALVLKDSKDVVRLSEHLETSGEVMFHKACELHAEGIISKRADGRYVSGRSAEWLKLKCIHEQEFVVGGFTLPSKGHAGIQGVGALLLGYYDDDGNLIYAGRTGTGFTQATHSAIRTRLEKLKQMTSPFLKPPAEARRGAIWAKPELVAQVRFATWTADNLVRQASFQGLREDKKASEVRREEPVVKPRTARGAKGETPRVSRRNTAAKTSVINKASASETHAPIRLTHPDKTVDSETRLTKQQLADYYWEIASYMLPQIEGRPLSLVRCPEGSTKPCFFQKHSNSMLPAGVESVDVPDKKTGKPEPYITLSNAQALAGLAQMGVLEVHPWGSKNDDLEHPDRLIIDLDPDAAISWEVLAAAADEVRKRFKKIGLESFLKSTGGKGLHIVVPLETTHDWSTLKQFAHNFVLQIERANPRLYLTKMSKAARAGRIYLDYLRNERGATAVAAYSPRARSGAPVSLPLAWAELKLPKRPLFHVSDFADWKGRLSRNVWAKFLRTRQTLELKRA